MAMPDDFSHLPPELNVPFECSSCGSIFQLFGPEDGSDLCDCPEPIYRIYVSDAGKYTQFLERFIDLAVDVSNERDLWVEQTRDDLREE